MNIQQKIDNARARRAEKLSLGEPANNDARVSPTPKPAPRKAPEADGPKRPEPLPVSAPPQPPEAKARFPEIVMPPAPETPQRAEKPPRRLGWLFPMTALLLALILGVLFVVPQNAPPGSSLSEAEPLVPAPLPQPTQQANTPALEARSGLAEMRNAMSPENADGATSAVANAASTPPDAFFVEAVDPLRVLADTTTALPALLPAWSTKTQPLSLFSPTRDALFTPPTQAVPKATNLTVALIVPALADNDDVRAVATALDESGFSIRAPRYVNYVVRQTQVRYFHAADAASAATLAEAIGGALRDFTDFAPLPPEGLVEVFIAGRGPAARARPAPRGLVGDIRQLGTDVRNALDAITRGASE